MIVGVNDFVRRQVKGSGKTYAKTMGFESIAQHAESQMGKGYFTDGYRDGVRLVHVDESIINDFICPYVRLDETTKLIARVVRRRVSEASYIQIRALNGELLNAGKVELIIYRNDVLVENNENTTNFEWELISINSVPEGISTLPMGSVTMMRNQLNLHGGTKASYSPDEWAESVKFWQKYAPLEPDKEKI